MLRSRRDRAILTAACCLLWLPLLAARPLWHPDEPRFALLTRSMIQSGEYVAPMKSGEIYASKPLLHLWATSLVSVVAGRVDEVTLRLPSFVAALGGILLTYGLASSLFGARSGLIAALVLAADARYLTQAQWVSTDILLCCFVTAALACFHAGYRGRRSRWYLLMHVCCAFATLTKGPVGLVLPGLVILVFLAVQRDLREVLRLRLAEGALILCVLVGPWLLLFAGRAGPHDTWTLLVTENVDRYLHAWNNAHPWHYYLWRFPLDFLPWTLVLPAAAWHSRTRMEAPDRRFLWAWFAVVFVFYSATSGKRGVYILPAHVPAAILVGWFWDLAARAPWPGAARWLQGARWALGLAFAVGGAAMAWASTRVESLGQARAGVALWGLLISMAGLLILAMPARRSVAMTTLAVALTAAGVTQGVTAGDRHQEVLRFAGEIARIVPAGAPLGIVSTAEELAFYAGRLPDAELRPGKQMERWLGTPGVLYLVLDDARLDDLRARDGLRWDLLAERTLMKGRFYLVVKHPIEGS
jgi:4-amino-4-deoxy-L-arabinose transferase-like glycosyltransferase